MDAGWEFILRALIMPLLVIIGVMSAVPIWIWLERRLSARIHQRLGPNRVGPAGLFQPLADAVKLLFKEDITPSHVDRLVYLLAPVVALIPALAAFAVIPFGRDLNVRQYLFGGPVVATIPAQVADANVGVLWILALSSLAVYGVVLAGWASNNKFSLLGGVRSAAQMISYELALGLSVVAIVLSNSVFASASGASTLSLRTAVASQQGLGLLSWNAWWHLPAFLVFVVCAIAETNRAPFDLPEAESELTGGFHTEYSSFRFAMFFMGEYAHMTTLSAVGVTLFLGGWLSPFAGIPLLGALNVSSVPVLGALMPLAWFGLKVFLCIAGFIWLRFTLPRMRWDQLMKLGWMVLLPVALAWVAVTGVYHGLAGLVGGPRGLVPSFDPVDIYRWLVLLTYLGVGLMLYFRKTGKLAPAAA
ncbi:MAG: NADH-quinone oxidoreductase subunit NuoH [Fimbriimonadaceae bacterium]|nr:NADH-quinone oxidoreductase subunit NuoH [Fimbriimonadaceae bacterium]